MLSNRTALKNLTINLDLESRQLVAKAQDSARYLNSIGQSGSKLERGLQGLQGRFTGVAGAMATLGAPQPLIALTTIGNVARGLEPMFNPVMKGVSEFTDKLKGIDISPMANSLSTGFTKMLNTVKTITTEIINAIVRMITRITGMNIPLIGGSSVVGGGGSGLVQGLTQAGVTGWIGGKTATGKKLILPNVEKIEETFADIVNYNKNLIEKLSKAIYSHTRAVPLSSIYRVPTAEELKASAKQTSYFLGKMQATEYLGVPKYIGKHIEELKTMTGLSIPQRIAGAVKQFDSMGDAIKGIAAVYMPTFAKMGNMLKNITGSILKFIFNGTRLAAVGSIVGVVGLAFAGLSKLIVNSTKDLDKLTKSAKSFQMSNLDFRYMADFGAYSGWRDNAEQFIIRQMDRATIDARYGSKKKVDAFELVGIDINKNMSKWNRFQKILEGLNKLNKSDQQFAAMEIFGARNASQVIQSIDGYAETIERIQKNRDWTPYMDMTALEELQNKSTDIATQWSSLKDSFWSSLVPVGELGIMFAKIPVGALKTAKNIGYEIGSIIWGDNMMAMEAFKMVPAIQRMFSTLNDTLGLDEEGMTEAFERLEKVLEKIESPVDKFKDEMIDMKRLLDQNFMTQDQYNKYLEITVDSLLGIEDPIKKYREELDKINQLQDMGVLSGTQYADVLNKITDTLTSPATSLMDSIKSPMEKLQTELKEMNKIAQGYMVDGVKIGGLTDEQMIDYKQSKVSDYIKSLHSDFEGLLKFANQNKDLLSDEIWTNALKELINVTQDIDTPLSAFQGRLYNINDAFNEGWLNVEQYNKAIDDLVTGFQPATDSLDEISAKLINMSNLGKLFGTEDILDLTAGLLPIERISAIMDGMMLGSLETRRAFSSINTLFGQLQDEVFQLEEALSLGQITPMLFEEKLSPLLEGLREAQWIASNIFGSTFDMGSQWHSKQREMMDSYAEQMRDYQENMQDIMEDMWMPYQGPGAFSRVNWLDGGDSGPGTAGVASATQIAGLMATAQALTKKPEEQTADNTKSIAEKMDTLIRVTEKSGGLL